MRSPRSRRFTDYQVYTGTSAPFNFNGLVRHYFMRRGANVADIQVNLLPKGRTLRLKAMTSPSAYGREWPRSRRNTARVSRSPRFPPARRCSRRLSAEIYGPTDSSRTQLARSVREIFATTTGVVDIDTYQEEDQRKLTLTIDHEKAALHGISA